MCQTADQYISVICNSQRVCIMYCGTSFNAPLWCASFLVPLGIGHTERGCIGAYAMVASELTNPALVRP